MRGTTDIGDGVQAGCDELIGSSSGNAKAAILLTDGYQTAGAYLDEHLCFSDRGWPIYTIGLTFDADRDLLRTIADATGGEFAFLTEADTLTGTYLKIRSKLVGSDPVLDTTVSVMPQSTTTVAALHRGTLPSDVVVELLG